MLTVTQKYMHNNGNVLAAPSKRYVHNWIMRVRVPPFPPNPPNVMANISMRNTANTATNLIQNEQNNEIKYKAVYDDHRHGVREILSWDDFDKFLKTYEILLAFKESYEREHNIHSINKEKSRKIDIPE